MASRYGAKAKSKVGRALHEQKRGQLKSGSGAKVRSRKQAIAIGLSEARKEGGKVPAPPRRKSSAKKKSGGRSRSSASRRKRASRASRA